MLQHTDPEINYLLQTLENQRDQVMVANASLTKQVADLQKQLAATLDK